MSDKVDAQQGAKEEVMDILFIIDMSGSMGGEETEAAVVNGFNKVIAEQRLIPGEVRVSTVLFNNHSKVLHDRVPLSEVKEMERKDYLPFGSTALLDAVKTSLVRLHKKRKGASELQPLVVIMTDGHENSSRVTTRDEVKAFVTLLRDSGWQFLYFGANVDHFAEARGLGIEEEAAMAFDVGEKGVSCCMETTSSTVRALRNPRSRCKLKVFLK